jgi:Txe/YoeB family toxin of Txe-Axe toxin-antitoxin module
MQRQPEAGTLPGKPPLAQAQSKRGTRITQEHRLVYRVTH